MASLKPDPNEPPAAATAPTPNDTPHSKPQSKQQSTPQSQPNSSSQSKAPEPNPKEYYGYLFDGKSPTPVLDALLRAIGQYISANIGDTNVPELNPPKLADFYRAVGGDYDQLFLGCPFKSISYIWQALGVQHTLQPTDNPFEEPSVPALTLKGFVRWEAIQILLEPQEHVPFMQYAVRNWGLVHPDTGKPFPPDLPTEAFPSECDPETDAWHKECARRLREEATPKDEHPPKQRESEPRVHTTFTHVRNPQNNTTTPRQRPEMDYFQRERPVSYAHVPRSNYAGPYFSGPIPPRQRRMSSSNSGSSSLGGSSSSSPDRPPQRPSFSEIRRSEMDDLRPSSHLDPRRPHVPHRHSQSRPYSPSPSGSDSDVPPRANSKSRMHGPIPPPPTIRRMPVATPITPPIPIRSHRSEIRPDVRSDDVRRRSLPAEIKQKVTTFLSGSSERQRSRSGEKRHATNVAPTVRFRREHPSRLSRSVSGGSYPSDESEAGIPKYPLRRRRDRERERIRDRVIEKELLRDRSREEELERRRSRERAYLHPAELRRASSHAEIGGRNRDYTWDRRDRDRDSDYDWDGRRVVTSDERDSRDRKRYKDRRHSPIVTGVGGRRYPGETGWK
ncbi:uncharacterized protein F4812DRAFT_443822 [Daldinia caldariorum]|uniref:uncharacterized protein n=1 Tax=Daldinia caldariorum TaxID=326644 RepID=UPI002008E341|nr:uncharacterized protein F4812DRAFT_443822 [Daldinia caldariorum]KAI1464226.1 hypothetical protein F4812DRAFT_443822 [Daldinia caldariorum]